MSRTQDDGKYKYNSGFRGIGRARSGPNRGRINQPAISKEERMQRLKEEFKTCTYKNSGAYGQIRKTKSIPLPKGLRIKD